jgi:hypothetical protein
MRNKKFDNELKGVNKTCPCMDIYKLREDVLND